MKVRPFHSSKYPGVYHTCTKCTEGDNIEPKYKTQGKGGGRKCSHCKRLEQAGSC